MICSAEEALPFRKILKAGPFGTLACFVSGLILSALYSFYPVYAEGSALSVHNMMSILIIGGVLLQWPLGKISDYFDRRLVLLGLIAASIGVLLANFFIDGSAAWHFYLLAFLLGGVTFTLNPVSITQVCDQLDPKHLTKASALMLIAYGIGSASGPAICSAFVSFFGINSMFLYLTGVLAFVFAFGLITICWKHKVPTDEQNEFVALPPVTPVASELDPRGDEKKD